MPCYIVLLTLRLIIGYEENICLLYLFVDDHIHAYNNSSSNRQTWCAAEQMSSIVSLSFTSCATNVEVPMSLADES